MKKKTKNIIYGILALTIYGFILYRIAYCHGKADALGKIYKEFPDLKEKRLQKLADDAKQFLQKTKTSKP